MPQQEKLKEIDNFEIEIKIPIEDPERIMKSLLTRGFQKYQRVIEEDMYYNSEYHDVRKCDEALRIRKTRDLLTGKTRAQINFKGKKIDQISMSRREYETGIEDPDCMEKILGAIGFTRAAGVKKTRNYLQRGELTACLDQVENLGNFLELEVIVRKENLRERYLSQMREILQELGLSMDNTVRASYLSMLMGKEENIKERNDHGEKNCGDISGSGLSCG